MGKGSRHGAARRCSGCGLRWSVHSTLGSHYHTGPHEYAQVITQAPHPQRKTNVPEGAVETPEGNTREILYDKGLGKEVFFSFYKQGSKNIGSKIKKWQMGLHVAKKIPTLQMRTLSYRPVASLA